jgi:hypothetical protein
MDDTGDLERLHVYALASIRAVYELCCGPSMRHTLQAGKEGTLFLLNRTQLANPHDDLTNNTNAFQEILPPELPASQAPHGLGMYSTASLCCPAGLLPAILILVGAKPKLPLCIGMLLGPCIAESNKTAGGPIWHAG